MTEQADQIVHTTRTAIATMSRLERAEQLARTVYEHVKLRVLGGDTSAERDSLGDVLTAATENADQARAAHFRRPDTPGQDLLDRLLDQACRDHPTADWVITVPEELGAMLPMDGGWLSRPGPGGGPGGYNVDVYRGFQLEAMPLTKPVIIISDITAVALSRYLNLNTGQVGADMIEIGLLRPDEA